MFASIWIITSLAYRLSNYSLPPSSVELSKGAIHVGPLMYGLEKKNKEELMEYLYPRYAPVLNEINSNPNAKIYRIGTYFQYFIDRK